MASGAQLKIRLPADIKAFVEAEAERNASSQSSEIVRSVRERMDRIKAATGEKFGDRTPAAVHHDTALAGGPANHG